MVWLTRETCANIVETRQTTHAMTCKEASAVAPRKVLLFSGHMIDAPMREEPRFPQEKEPLAADAIMRTLARIAAGPEDLAICGGACGGDLLFAEAALARGVKLELYISRLRS